MPETDPAVDPGPIPTPEVTAPEHYPGGVDAIDQSGVDDYDDPPIPHDLAPEDNPAVDEVLPPEIAAPDEHKEQAPSEGVSGEGEQPTEPPA